MKARFLRFSLILAMLFAALPSFADEASIIIDLVEYRITGNRTMEVSQCGKDGHVTILGEVMYDGKFYTVTSIGKYAFAGCTITGVTLPNSIETIEDGAFYQCTASSIDLNYGLGYIGAYAFYECTSLERIQIPSTVLHIGEFAFYGCYCKLIFAGNVPASTEYWSSSFLIGSQIKEVELLEGAVRIGECAFAKLETLEKIKLPSSLRNIDTGAFLNCTSLKGVYINDLISWYSKIKFDSFAWYGDISDNNPLRIAGNLYLNGDLVTNLTISTDSVMPYAFSGCKNIESINLKNGVKYIGDGAFKLVDAKTLYFPPSVSELGAEAFIISTLESIYIENLTHWCGFNHSIIKSFASSNGTVPSLLPEKGTTDLYLNGKQITELVVPGDVERIGDYAFNNISINSVTMGDNVTIIGKGAFSFTNIEDIEITDNIEKIDNNAFEFTNLTEIVIPANVDTLGRYVFCNCFNLSKVTIEEGVLSLGSGVFNSTRISDLIIPNSIKELPMNIWSGGYDVSDYSNPQPIPSSITLPDNIEKLHNTVFGGGSITTITIGTNTKSIETRFFPSNLEKLYMKPITPPEITPNTWIETECYIYDNEQDYDEVTLYVPTGCKENYKRAEHWNKFKNIVEIDFTDIDEVFDDVKGENGKVKTIYDLQGRKVEVPSEGLYIINGKKVVIK